MSVGSSPPGGVFGGGGALGQLISILQTIAQNIGFLSKQVGNSFVSLSTANTFTAAQTFTPPPVIEAGATGTGTFIPSGAISKQFAASGVGNGADTTDDTLFTYSLPASSLDVAGRTLRVRAFGQFAGNTHNKTVKIFFGTSIVLTSGVVTTSGLGWTAELMIGKTGSNTQIAGGFVASGATLVTPVVLTGTETDTNAVAIKVTGASSTTGAANDVVGYGMVVEFLN